MRRIISALLIFLTVLSISAVSAAASSVCDTPKEETYFRLHIRANSDSKADQELKLKVKDSVTEFIEKCFDSSDISTKTDAMTIIEKNLNEINALAKKTMRGNSCTLNVECLIDREHFPACEYEGMILPEGDYDSLIIEIGEGTGHNWWCVLFASDNGCAADASSENKTDPYITDLGAMQKVKYEFWITNVLKELFSK